ncbi:MAG: hypothetical protein ABIB79_00365 [archaeon]
MSEICKTCRNKFDSGIWLASEFNDEKVLLFCSDKCKKKYLKMKLRRIKIEYPKYYEKLKGSSKKSIYDEVLDRENE